MTRLIFVRHGESQANQLRLFAGSSNFALTEKGVAQAQAAAQELKKYKIDAVYASDLQRAYYTGLAIARSQPCPIYKNSGLREISAGLWESCSFDTIAKDYPQMHTIWTQNIGRAILPQGESVAQLYSRVKTAVMNIIDQNSGKTICLATHATPIRAMEAVWNSRSYDHMQKFPWVSNASISVVDFDQGCWKVIVRGYNGHLGALNTELPKNI